MKKPNPDTPDQEAGRLSPKEAKRRQFFERLRENRKKAGPGNQYYYHALQKSIPMVFRTYEGQDILGTIAKDGGTQFTLKTAQGRQVIKKIELQFSYRAHSLGEVHQAIEMDERIRSLVNPPVVEVSQRYQIPDDTLQRCQEEGNKLRVTMRGGEILEGRVEWFGAYDIKLELSTGRSVVVFRHAVYQHAGVQ